MRKGLSIFVFVSRVAAHPLHEVPSTATALGSLPERSTGWPKGTTEICRLLAPRRNCDQEPIVSELPRLI